MTFALINSGVTPYKKTYDVAREVYRYFLGAGFELGVIFGSTTVDDHNNLRCIDFSSAHATDLSTGKRITADRSFELGDAIADYVWMHRERIGLNWEIWNRRIRRHQNTNRTPIGVWAPYSGASHTDHVHIEIDSEPFTPWQPPTPNPPPGALIMAIEGLEPIEGYQHWTDLKESGHLSFKTEDGKRKYSLWHGPAKAIDVLCTVAVADLGDARARLYFELMDYTIATEQWASFQKLTPGVIVNGEGDTWEGQISLKDFEEPIKVAPAGHQYRLRIGLDTPVPVRYRIRTGGGAVKP